MTLLADVDIIDALVEGDVALDPWEPAALQPASVDVRLHHLFRRFTRIAGIDLADVPEDHTEVVDGTGGVWLPPGGFLLGSTVETVRIGRHHAASVEGRSSLGRLGLVVHTTAGWIDPGFCGQVTLEIVNHGPVSLRLHPGMRVAQLAFHRLASPAARPYDKIGHYQGQQGPTESRFRLD